MPAVSIHVRDASTKQVADALTKITKRTATVSTSDGDWVTVWDEMSELVAESERVGRELSAALSRPVVVFRVSKNEVIYFVYEGGIYLDRYNSSPDYYGEVSDAERAAVVGRPDVLLKFTKPGTDRQQLVDVLSGAFEPGGEMEYERERGAALTDLLGIRRGRVDSRFDPEDAVEDGEGFVTVENPVGMLSKELFEAIKACHVEGVVALLDRGAPLEQTDEWGYTPLARAVETEYPSYEYVSPQRLQVVRALIGRGTSRPAIQDVFNSVVARQALRLIEPLIETGADVNQVDALGRTPLIAALEYPYASPDVIRCLLRVGANPSAAVDRKTMGRTLRGMTPLHLAAQRSVDVVRLLLEAGADPHARDAAGDTPLIVAARRGKSESVALLLAAGGVDDARLPDGTSILSSLISQRDQSPDLDRVIAILRDNLPQ